MFDTIVVATDGSTSVTRAIDVALDLAARFDADVHALSVVDEREVDASPEELRDDLEQALERHAESALATVDDRAGSGVTTAVHTGRPAEVICDYARDHDADLLVTGTRGRHGENRLLLGSVAERVVRTAPIPVLTVRQLETPADDETAVADA
ncbi:universal stress protein [Natronobiforma cellulositropha]|uniref:universal stress protein n=1 Tax=Natronobiforma cellulositropha TaxID=1679076 RepID=UPI0021D581DC|nr:universal stress protein [Natronobiforma cellulositropha]